MGSLCRVDGIGTVRVEIGAFAGVASGRGKLEGNSDAFGKGRQLGNRGRTRLEQHCRKPAFFRHGCGRTIEHDVYGHHDGSTRCDGGQDQGDSGEEFGHVIPFDPAA